MTCIESQGLRIRPRPPPPARVGPISTTACPAAWRNTPAISDPDHDAGSLRLAASVVVMQQLSGTGLNRNGWWRNFWIGMMSRAAALNTSGIAGKGFRLPPPPWERMVCSGSLRRLTGHEGWQVIHVALPSATTVSQNGCRRADNFCHTAGWCRTVAFPSPAHLHRCVLLPRASPAECGPSAPDPARRCVRV